MKIKILCFLFYHKPGSIYLPSGKAQRFCSRCGKLLTEEQYLKASRKDFFNWTIGIK